MRRAIVVVLALANVACVARIQRRVIPDRTREWLTAISQAQQATLRGRYREAERLLEEFAAAHAGSPEAREALFRGALLNLDPANPRADIQEAANQLDLYLAGTEPAPHRSEALLLRRVASAVDSLKRAANQPNSTVVITPVIPNPEAPRSDRQSQLQREVQQLQEQLDKANAELERIKKRLAEPTPPPAETRRDVSPTHQPTQRETARSRVGTFR